MSVSRAVLLGVLMLLLACALLGGQLMILAQQSVLKTSFLLPHVERLFSTISAPQTHEEIVRYLVSDLIRGSRVRGVPADMRERLMKASVTALSPQWIQGELLEMLNKTLAVLRGRSQQVSHTIYLSRRKDVLISELARDLPPGEADAVRAASGMVPDAVEITDLIGTEAPQLLIKLGQRSILFSLLFIYVVPGLLVLLGLQVGRIKWGIVGVGAAALVSGLAAIPGLGSAHALVQNELLPSALSRLPSAFGWVPGFLRELLVDAVSLGRSIAVAFAASGAAILAVGILVVILMRKKPA